MFWVWTWTIEVAAENDVVVAVNANRRDNVRQLVEEVGSERSRRRSVDVDNDVSRRRRNDFHDLHFERLD